MVAEIEELEQMDASELHARRLNAKEMLTHMKNEKIVFLIADETVENLWRRSTSENIHLKSGIAQTEEKNKNFFEENQADSLLQPFFKKTQRGMMRKLKVTSDNSLEFGKACEDLSWNHCT